jgi:signal transduction histidine kinase
MQLEYLILGITLTVIVVFITNFILPLLNIHELRQTSSLLFLIFDVFVLIAINRKRFYGIQSILLKGLQVSILGVVLYFVVFFIRFIQAKVLLLDFFDTQSQLIDLLACITVASLLIIFLDNYQDKIGSLTNDGTLSNRILFENLEEILSSDHDLKRIRERALDIINSNFKASISDIVDSDFNNITQLSSNNIYIAQENQFKTINSNLLKINIGIISKLNDSSFLIFTNKSNNNAFDKEEIEFIEKLSIRLRLHYQTEELYQKTKDFSQLLQNKVDEQTNALQTAYDELKREDEGKNDILNIVSHQLLTPVSILRGEIEELKEAPNETTKNEIIDTLAFQAKRSYEIVDEILRVSRVIQKGGRLDVIKSETDIVAMIESVIKTFTNKAHKANLTLNFSKPPGLKKLNIAIDKEQITEVISNLIDNAIIYTPKGGVDVELDDHQHFIILKITDTGIGINKDNLKDLFNKFVRLDNAKKIRPDGTGIGLYFIKLIIDAHNGEISVKSEGEGKGSQFILKLFKN